MRFLRKIGQRGTVTLPNELRDAMDIHEGDLVEFDVLHIVSRRVQEPPQTPSNAPPTPEARES